MEPYEEDMYQPMNSMERQGIIVPPWFWWFFFPPFPPRPPFPGLGPRPPFPPGPPRPPFPGPGPRPPFPPGPPRPQDQGLDHRFQDQCLEMMKTLLIK